MILDWECVSGVVLGSLADLEEKHEKESQLVICFNHFKNGGCQICKMPSPVLVDTHVLLDGGSSTQNGWRCLQRTVWMIRSLVDLERRALALRELTFSFPSLL